MTPLEVPRGSFVSVKRAGVGDAAQKKRRTQRGMKTKIVAHQVFSTAPTGVANVFLVDRDRVPIQRRPGLEAAKPGRLQARLIRFRR